MVDLASFLGNTFDFLFKKLLDRICRSALMLRPGRQDLLHFFVDRFPHQAAKFNPPPAESVRVSISNNELAIDFQAQKQKPNRRGRRLEMFSTV